jgi:hypothetical protein
MKRRHFIALSATAASGLALIPSALAAETSSARTLATTVEIKPVGLHILVET